MVDDSTVDEIVCAINESMNEMGRVDIFIEKMLLAKKNGDKTEAERIYREALCICESREWYGLASKVCEANGNTLARDNYKEYGRNIREQERERDRNYRPDFRGSSWIDGND